MKQLSLLLLMVPAALTGASSSPYYFEPVADGAYAARASRYTVELRSASAVFRADQQEVQMRLVGAREVISNPSERQAGVSHYYLSEDSAKWRTFVPHFSRVEYRGVYSGIDVQYYFRGQELEYDFILAPGARVSQIRLRFEGMERLRINRNGELELQTAGGLLKKRRPIAYQRIGGSRVPVDAAFTKNGETVSFSVGKYDPRHELVIDPSVAYATYFGGAGQDDATAMVVDGTGSVVLAGLTQSASLPGAIRASANQGGFVTKLSPDGRSTVFTTYLSAGPGALAADASGAAYLGGATGDGLPVLNAFQSTFGGGNFVDGFIMKLRSNGTMAFSSYLGGNNVDGVLRKGVALDSNGALYVAGTTSSTNFPVLNAFQPAFGGYDAFLMKLDATSGALRYSTSLGAGSAYALAVDANNNPVVVGQTGGRNIPLVNPIQATPGGDSDGFVMRIRADGTGILFSTLLGDANIDQVYTVTPEQDGGLVISGWFGGRPFLSRITPANQLVQLLAPRNAIESTAVDQLGNIWAAGYTSTLDPAIPMVNSMRAAPLGANALLIQLSRTGEVLYSSFWGGSVFDAPCSLAIDSSGAVYVALTTASPDAYTKNALQPAFAGVRDAFVVKFAGTATERISALVVSSSFTAVPVTVNGQQYSGKRLFQDVGAATYTISVPETLDVDNVRYSFVKWNDNGPRTRTVTVNSDDVTLTAEFSARVRPSLQVLPLGSGTIDVSPASSDGYYPVGPLTFPAVPSPGYVFHSWGGNLSGTTNPQAFSVQINGPFFLAATAIFQPSQPPPPRVGNTFINLPPCRIMDTRPGSGFTGLFGPPVLERGSSRQIPLPLGRCFLPPNASAYALNITVVPQEPLAYLTAWPAGQPQPVVSTLNSFDAQTVANAAIVPAGASGAIQLFVSSRTNVIIDVFGYFMPEHSPASLYFSPLTPCRLMDTRVTDNSYGQNGAPSVSAGRTRRVAVEGRCAVLPGANTLSLNVTAVPKGPLEYLTVTPDLHFPGVSTVNSTLGQVRANAAITAVTPPQQGFNLFASNETDVVIDVNGYFSPLSTEGLRFYPLVPCRLADTRTGSGFSGLYGAPFLQSGVRRDFSLINSGCAVPAQARAFSLNATVVPKGPLAYLTLWPAGSAQPLVSTLNAFEGQVLANAAIVPAGSNGSISAFAPDATDLILDINGYFAP